MTDRAEIQRWMSAAADGDRTAIDPLFHALWPVLVGYATRFLADAALAEDCAQEAIVKLYGQVARFDRERDALTWALTHVTWQCRTARRKIVRRAESLVVDAVDVDSFDGVLAAEERDLVRAAVDTLAELAAHDRDVIATSLMALKNDELRHGLAPATFRKRLERALARLRASWRSRHGIL